MQNTLKPNQLILLKSYSILMKEACNFFDTTEYLELFTMVTDSYNRLNAILELGDDLIVSELELILAEADEVIITLTTAFIPAVEKANKHYNVLVEEFNLLLDTLETFKDHDELHLFEIDKYLNGVDIDSEIENNPSVFREINWLEPIINGMYCIFSERVLLKTIQLMNIKKPKLIISSKEKVVELFSKKKVTE